jgi:hypothetical protein
MSKVTDYGPIQAPNHLGIAVWQFEAALRRGLIPPADRGGRWSAALIDDAAARIADIVAAVGDQAPIGANRAAERIGERLQLDVDRADVDSLAERGLLAAVDEYKGWPLYDVADLDRVAETEPELLAALVAERTHWIDTSLRPRDARERLGLSRTEFDKVIRERGVQPGRFQRYATVDIDALAGDEDLLEDVRANRLLGPDQAAEHMEIRRTDFDYCVAAGWIAPATHAQSQISRRRWIDVPLFRIADVEALREIPDVDWEAVRSVRPGDPSPLRQFATLPLARSTLVRGFAADLAERYGIEVTAKYDDDRDQWQLRWTPNPDGEPTRKTVRQAITTDRHLAAHAAAIVLYPADS